MKVNLLNLSLIKKPSAYLPLAMSLAALTLVLAHAAVFGITHDADGGAVTFRRLFFNPLGAQSI